MQFCIKKAYKILKKIITLKTRHSVIIRKYKIELDKGLIILKKMIK